MLSQLMHSDNTISTLIVYLYFVMYKCCILITSVTSEIGI